MGIRNYLIEGGSGTGKTAVATELERRGYHVVHGDRVLSYQGDPQTGEPVTAPPQLSGSQQAEFTHGHHIWDVAKVKSLLADHRQPVSFLCGGSRNFEQFIELFDAVFVLELDLETLNRRLDSRPDEWGANPAERALILRLHASREDVPPNAIPIDATSPLTQVVEAILAETSGDQP
jgi:gluconate kinase